jgi:hypothetical protein
MTEQTEDFQRISQRLAFSAIIAEKANRSPAGSTPE